MQFGRLQVRATVLFEPRDCWIGVFWDRAFDGIWDIYVCIVPMLPIYFTLDNRHRDERE